MIGVRDESHCDCGCGMTSSECECGSEELEYEAGDYCPLCNDMLDKNLQSMMCDCGKVNENGPAITYSSAKSKFYPKGDENIKKVSKNMEKAPGNKITGADMGNAMAGQPSKQAKPKKMQPIAMKVAKEPKL